jgi:hypothetical protein
MKTLTAQQLVEAWDAPLKSEDPGRDFLNRLEAVQDAVRAANGDPLGYWNVVREVQAAAPPKGVAQ